MLEIRNKPKKRCVPIWVIISVALFALSAVIYEISKRVPAIAENINSTVSVAVRLILSKVTYLLPISLFELLIIFALPLLILFIVILIKSCNSARERVRNCMALLGVIAIILTSYIFMLGIGYYADPVANKLGLTDEKNISADELYDTALTVQNELNAIALKLSAEDGETHMEYSVSELSKRISRAYDTFTDEYDILYNFTSRAKPVMFSGIMADLRITGIYSFFTGEANVNVEYPDYNLPFTVAHEFAHQRGICRENEANFIAFLVCISSDDDYIRYSGYLNLYEYLRSALYSADKELFKTLDSDLAPTARKDINASVKVYNEHKDSILGEINDRLNDVYLKFNGTDGTVTYSYVVRLAVSWYSRSTD